MQVKCQGDGIALQPAPKNQKKGGSEINQAMRAMKNFSFVAQNAGLLSDHSHMDRQVSSNGEGLRAIAYGQ